VKTLWIRDQYLQQILAGLKTVEVRVAYPSIARLRAGDLLLLNDCYRYRIRRAATYPGCETLLADEDPAAIAPGLPSGHLLAALREIYTPEREALSIEPAPEETRT